MNNIPNVPATPTLPANIDFTKLNAETIVKPGSKIHLHKDFDASRVDAGITKAQGLEALEQAKAVLFDYQDKFYAQSDRSLLIVIQGIDAAGKDGTIKHVMEGINPEGVDVYSFKEPSKEEMSHDYLWRHNLALPELGKIAIFNRSHYENVLVTRVHPELLWPRTAIPFPSDIWSQRYQNINDWEKRLNDNGTVVVKLFLHLSRQEQGRRFMSRIDDPSKHWKVSPTDMVERGFWDDYTAAFSDMLGNTSTEYAPWHVIPADHKWFSHLSTMAVLLEAMKTINPSYPTVSAAVEKELADMKKELEAGK